MMKKKANAMLAKNYSRRQRPVSNIKKAGDEETAYFESFIDLNSPLTTIINEFSDVEKPITNFVRNIISLKNLNQADALNEFIENINHILPNGGLLAGKFLPQELRAETERQSHDTTSQRGLNFMKKKWQRLRSLFHLNGHVQTEEEDEKANNLPLAEILGRIAAGGFEILDYKEFGDQIYFIAEKNNDASFDPSESRGAIFKMKRIGEGGQIKEYYKFRTMHLYAEYLQNFIYQQNGLEDGDKFKKDFRVTKIGTFLRKYWLDELPMIINLLKGDLKLVGVRPLSRQKFNLYFKSLQNYRTKFKPGLIPPFYADMPDSLQELMGSEVRYLRSYEKSPLKTDVKYFFKALYNIFLRGKRSH